MPDTSKDSAILARWRSGDDGVQIAKALGIGSTSVYRALKRHGIRPSKEKRRPKVDWRRRFTREQEGLIVKRYMAGENMAAIADALGCNRLTIRNILIRENVPIRPVGKPPREWSATEIADVVERYRAGELLEDIARAHNAESRAITRLLAGMGGRAGRARRPSGGITNVGGYRMVLIGCDDPMASMRSSQGYVMEHRLVMARNLGRPLTKNETVHHVNGDKFDNRIANLELRHGQHGKHQAFRCRACGSTDVEPVTLTQVAVSLGAVAS
jgi:hypothetical protein